MGSGRTLSGTIWRWLGLAAGPLLGFLTFGALGAASDSLPPQGRATAAVAVWMAVWWLSEAIPIAATALLPVTVLPLLGARSVEQSASSYAHPLIFLFLGGFVVALAMERWGLHRRIALSTLRLVGTRPRNVVGGFMAVTALLSMWISNTATAVMMLPIAVSVIDLVGEHTKSETGPPEHSDNFPTCMLLGVAYGASIGGLGTLVGTPPNLFLASYVQQHLGSELGFARWMSFGVPLVALLLPVTWLLLTRLLYRVPTEESSGGRDLLRRRYRELGPPKRGEIITLSVFALMALGWLLRPTLQDLELAGSRPLQSLSDPGVALFAALALFVIPVDPSRRVFAMDWATARELPWGVLLLFGGGLSLAAAMEQTGVTEFVGAQVQVLRGTPAPVVMIAVGIVVVFLTEVTSNTATAAAFIPVLAGIAPALDMHPYTLIVPAALAASCAFMMPVATPPNAVVFGSGRLTIPQMARAGLWLNLIAVAVVSAFTWWLALPLLGL